MNDSEATLLTAAVKRNTSKDTIQLLLKKCNNINWADEKGNTALLLAIYYERSSEIINCLLSHGADVHQMNNAGYTSLMLAIQFHAPKAILQLLLKSCNNINQANRKGDTALILGFLAGSSPESIILLLRHGADANCINTQGDTPLHLAVCRHQVLPWFEDARRILEYLLLYGANPNTLPENELSLRMQAYTEKLQVYNRPMLAYLSSRADSMGREQTPQYLATLVACIVEHQALVKHYRHYRKHRLLRYAEKTGPWMIQPLHELVNHVPHPTAAINRMPDELIDQIRDDIAWLMLVEILEQTMLQKRAEQVASALLDPTLDLTQSIPIFSWPGEAINYCNFARGS